MKNKKIIIIVMIISIILCCFSVILIPKILKKDPNISERNYKTTEKSETKKEIIKNESTSEDIIIDEKNIIESESKVTDSEKVEVKVEENKKYESVKVEEKNNNENAKKDELIKEENSKEEKNETNNTNIEIKEEPKAWEELGITEDEYYNKPMWNWARIDYSINEYKTYEKTREACMKRGEQLFQEGYGYSCTSINSFSGKYLGEMLKTF